MTSAADRIKELEEFKVVDFQPKIEALSEYVCYETGYYSNPNSFVDRDGFPSRFVKEAETISKLVFIFNSSNYNYNYYFFHSKKCWMLVNILLMPCTHTEVFQELCPSLSKTLETRMTCTENSTTLLIQKSKKYAILQRNYSYTTDS